MPKVSRGGKRVGSKGNQQRGHIPKWYEPPSMEKQLAADLGIPLSLAKIEYNSVYTFTGGDYSAIRKAYRDDDKTSSYYPQIQNLEDFIAQSPKWNGGTLYRGIAVDAPIGAQFVKGATVDMKGASSWSSSKSIARDFAGRGSTDESFIFQAAKTKKGTSVKHIAEYANEDEVLISNSAKWIIKSVKKDKKLGVSVVTVEELD